MNRSITLWIGLLVVVTNPLFADEDPYIWLEEVTGKKALEWVVERNRESLSVLEALPTFQPMFDRHLEIYNSDKRIATPTILGDYIYNFWKDENYERGLWRRTTLAGYREQEPEWETVLDLDALANAEEENWVYKGADCLYPKYERCILSLSRGGADATVSREFDMVKKEFVEDGYYLPEAKGGISWIDEDNVMVMTDFGDNTMTDSGYPRIVKLWKRGTPVEEAVVIYEGIKEDVGTFGYMINTAEGNYPYILRADTFFTSKKFLLQDGSPVALDLPDDADIEGVFRRQVLVTLKSDWTVGDKTYPQGALISIDSDSLLGGGRDFYTVVEPGERATISSISTTRDSVLINMLNNVRSELHRYTFDGERWHSEPVDAPSMGTISVVSASNTDDTFFYTYEGFLSPDTLYLSDKGGKSEKIKSLPDFFDSDPYQTVQYSAISKDGTAIPYFLVARKELVLNGKNPTLLYGYGGFEISRKATYSATIGGSWLDQGGIYVNANIRGGGEFGPAWHHAALKEKRHKAYEDFIAVAEDLIERGFTSPQHLGIKGGSNGGLLVGAVVMMRPDLFNAVVCQVPLLDMKRYNHLLAGASWMGEYGNPDIPEEWAYIKKYSPYHNLDAGKTYPKIFFTTSTRDDRVHPGHARKMVARMMEMDKPLYYYENTEGGHAGAANLKQSAYVNALIYSYLLDQLKS